MRISFDVECAPLVERECSACGAQRSVQSITAEHVSDLHIDEMGHVNAHGRVLHPLRDALACGRIQQQLDRPRSIQDQQRCLLLSLVEVPVVGVRVVASVPFRAKHIGWRCPKNQLGLSADGRKQFPPARPLQCPLNCPHHIL